ncbi:MAG: hypothetical protein ACPF8V_01850 [Luteibaculum sp.]
MRALVICIIVLLLSAEAQAQIKISRDPRDHQYGLFVGMEFMPKISSGDNDFEFATKTFLRVELIDLYDNFGIYFDYKGAFKREYLESPDPYKNDLYYSPANNRISLNSTTVSRTVGVNYQFLEFIHFNFGLCFARFNSGYDVDYINTRTSSIGKAEYGETVREVKPEFGIGITPIKNLKLGLNYNSVYKAFAFNISIGGFLATDGLSNLGGGVIRTPKAKKPRKSKYKKDEQRRGSRYFGI